MPDLPAPLLIYVEDELLIQGEVIAGLEDAGFRLVVANGGEQALQLLSEHHEELRGVVTDVDLGTDIDGWEIARAARCQRHWNNPQKWRSKIPHFAICGSVGVLAGASIFGRAAATPGLSDAWQNGLGQQVCVATQAIAGACDLNDDGVMKQPVQKRRRDHRASEDFAPFGKTAVGGEDHRALFVAGVDELEEEIAAARHDGQVTDLIDDQQCWTAVEADPLAQRAFAFGLGERTDQIGQRQEVHALAGLHCFDAQGCRQVAFAGARWPKKMDDFATIDKVQLGERHDPGLVQRGLEREVIPGQRFDRAKPPHHQRSLDAAVFTERELFEQQLLDRLERSDFAMIEPADTAVDDLDRPWHFQTDHAGLDPVEQRCAGIGKKRAHAAIPAASRRPTAS